MVTAASRRLSSPRISSAWLSWPLLAPSKEVGPIALALARPSEQRAQHPAHDLAADAVADSARCALRHGFDEAVAATASAAGLAGQSEIRQVGVPRLLLPWLLRSACRCGLSRASLQNLKRRFAIDSVLIHPGD